MTAAAPHRRLPLTAPELAAVDAFVEWLRRRFGERVAELRLFGSRARGAAESFRAAEALLSLRFNADCVSRA